MPKKMKVSQKKNENGRFFFQKMELKKTFFVFFSSHLYTISEALKNKFGKNFDHSKFLDAHRPKQEQSEQKKNLQNFLKLFDHLECVCDQKIVIYPKNWKQKKVCGIGIKHFVFFVFFLTKKF